jgi:hypothetical protein
MIESATPPISSATVHPSPTAPLSDAGVHLSDAGVCSSAAGLRLSTAGGLLFAEGVPDAPGDLVEQAPAFCAQLVSMLNTLDSWNSLVEHYKASKKSKKD